MRGVFSGIYCENLVKHLKVKFIHTESLNWVLLELLTDLSTLSLSMDGVLPRNLTSFTGPKRTVDASGF
jgi:hypothetical protein